MCHAWRKYLVSALILLGSVGPVLAYDQEQETRTPTGDEMFNDTWAGRPLGLLATVMGAVTFVVALPFTLPSHSVNDAAKMLVADPVKWTFRRPLGRFISCDEQPDYCK